MVSAGVGVCVVDEGEELSVVDSVVDVGCEVDDFMVVLLSSVEVVRRVEVVTGGGKVLRLCVVAGPRPVDVSSSSSSPSSLDVVAAEPGGGGGVGGLGGLNALEISDPIDARPSSRHCGCRR
jgi:hypothetical protein